MRLRLFAAAAAATALCAAPSAAQIPNITPFSFEARAGLAVPTGDLKDEGDAEPGLTLSGSVTYHLMPLIGVYAGYSRNEFGADDASDAESFRDEGVAFGVRVAIPTPLIPIDPWVRGGLVRHRLTVEFDGESDELDADWGYEVGAGLGFAFTNKLSITPGITYTTYSPPGVDISHVRLDVGVRLRL